MRSLICLILTFLLTAPAFAQGQRATTPAPALPATGFPDPGPAFNTHIEWPTRVFAIKYVALDSIATLIRPFGLDLREETTLNAISVHGPAPSLTAIEDLIKRFDVPANAAKNVDLTIYLVLGGPEGEPDNVPQVLRPVVDQLHAVMAYKSYRLLDTSVQRIRSNGDVHSGGILPRLSDRETSTFEFDSRVRVFGEGADQGVRLENLRFNLVYLNGSSSSRLVISTSLDVKKGQQVVVGKTSLPDRAMILVVSAKLVD